MPESGALTPADRTKQRNEANVELVKALLIINGGGAVALLAFLQATWVTAHNLAKPVVVAVGLFALGAFAAAAFHLLRHQASWHHQFGKAPLRRFYDRAYLGAAVASLLLFLAGIATVVLGIWHTL